MSIYIRFEFLDFLFVLLLVLLSEHLQSPLFRNIIIFFKHLNNEVEKYCFYGCHSGCLCGCNCCGLCNCCHCPCCTRWPCRHCHHHHLLSSSWVWEYPFREKTDTHTHIQPHSPTMWLIDSSSQEANWVKSNKCYLSVLPGPDPAYCEVVQGQSWVLQVTLRKLSH